MKRTVMSALLAVVGLATALVVKHLPAGADKPEAAILDTLRNNGAI